MESGWRDTNGRSGEVHGVAVQGRADVVARAGETKAMVDGDRIGVTERPTGQV